jgi:alkylated DNA repair protein (DNA oxidative demethylase)
VSQGSFGFAAAPEREVFAPGALLLRGFARPVAAELLAAIAEVAAVAPFRTMVVPGGGRMAVAITNCGACGWTSDRRGYRYADVDPDSGRPWPMLPPAFGILAGAVAAAAGYVDFVPDACLVNRYEPGAGMGLHQDRNERDLARPIVSVSLGLPAVFRFGGVRRTHPTQTLALEHGDVAVWGGPSRLAFHGVRPLADGVHPATGRCRFNLTLRVAR